MTALDIIVEVLKNEIASSSGGITEEQATLVKKDYWKIIVASPDRDKLRDIYRLIFDLKGAIKLKMLNDIVQGKPFYRLKHRDGAYIHYNDKGLPIITILAEQGAKFYTKEQAEKKRRELANPDAFEVVED